MSRIERYRIAVDRLLALINTGHTPSAKEERLEVFESFLKLLGSPHKHGRFVHAAGSKGKSSIVLMVASILAQSGHKTLSFTSPALHKMNERIRIMGAPVDEDDFSAAAEQVLDAYEEFGGSGSGITFFDCLTAIAFLIAAKLKADFTVLETGLGGRLDSTNVVTPVATVISRIELEHTHILGDTIEQIAREKAGIIKRGAPVIVSTQHPDAMAVIIEKARSLEAPLWKQEDHISNQEIVEAGVGYQKVRLNCEDREYLFQLPTMGRHQADNAATALLTARVLQIPPPNIVLGLQKAALSGSVQLVSNELRTVIADGCHTPMSARALQATLKAHLGHLRKLAVVFGTTQGHDTVGTLTELKPLGTRFVFTQPHHPRALPRAQLEQMAQSAGIDAAQATFAPSVKEAIEKIAPDNTTLACGSIAVAAEAIQSVTGLTSDFW